MTKMTKPNLKLFNRYFFNTRKVEADPITTAFATHAANSVLSSNMPLLVGLSIAIIMTIARVRGYMVDIPVSPSTDGSGDTNMPDPYIPPGLLLQLQQANSLIDTYIILISRIKENIISVLPLLSASVLESTHVNIEVIIRFHEYIFQYLGRYLNEYAELLGDVEPYQEMENLHEL
jgi:hypothetical protein